MATPTCILMYGVAPESIVDGPGLRFGVFVQGCSHHCPGCHNPESQLTCEGAGYVETIDHLMGQITENKLIKNVTLSGGEPFEQAAACAEVAKRCKALGFGVWAYTGYLYEDLANVAAQAVDEGGIAGEGETAASSNGEHPVSSSNLDPLSVASLLAAIDVLVDGPFVESKKSLDIVWRGSTNQRVIDMKATRATGKVVPYNHHYEAPAVPIAW